MIEQEEDSVFSKCHGWYMIKKESRAGENNEDSASRKGKIYY